VKSSQILAKMGSTSSLTRHGREEKLGQIDGSGWGRREEVYMGQLSAGQWFEPAQTGERLVPA